MSLPSLQANIPLSTTSSSSKNFVNSKYSSIPVNVATLCPTSVKDKINSMRILCIYTKINVIETSSSTDEKSSDVERYSPYGSIGSITHISPKDTQSKNIRQSKGSMFITDLWRAKDRKAATNIPHIAKALDDLKQAKEEDLNKKLIKLENAHQTRPKRLAPIECQTAKLFAEFQTQGINSSHLRGHNKAKSATTFMNSINETEEYEQMLNKKEISLPSLTNTFRGESERSYALEKVEEECSIMADDTNQLLPSPFKEACSSDKYPQIRLILKPIKEKEKTTKMLTHGFKHVRRISKPAIIDFPYSTRS